MLTIRCCVVASGTVVLFAAAGDVQAQSGRELAEKALCMSCHRSNERLAGPAFREIALKYAGIAGAEAVVAAKIRRVWRYAPMPPSTRLTDAEHWTLAAWIMSHAGCDGDRKPSAIDCPAADSRRVAETR